jgi:hypothetical protein
MLSASAIRISAAPRCGRRCGSVARRCPRSVSVLQQAWESANIDGGLDSTGGSQLTGTFDMSVQTKPSLNAAGSTQTAPGSTRRSFILTAVAAASSTLVQSEISRAAIVQTDTAKLAALPLPSGIRSHYVPNINGLTFHVLEAGFESKGRPCLLLLHGYPEIAYGWRKVMLPLASAGFHVLLTCEAMVARQVGMTRMTAMYFRFAIPIWSGMPSDWYPPSATALPRWLDATPARPWPHTAP